MEQNELNAFLKAKMAIRDCANFISEGKDDNSIAMDVWTEDHDQRALDLIMEGANHQENLVFGRIDAATVENWAAETQATLQAWRDEKPQTLADRMKVETARHDTWNKNLKMVKDFAVMIQGETVESAVTKLLGTEEGQVLINKLVAQQLGFAAPTNSQVEAARAKLIEANVAVDPGGIL